jgi:branched-chain amino acid transport system permease protein
MAAEHAIGLASDIAIMSLLALSAYLLLLVGRISFGQQAFFGIGAYASALASTLAHWPLAAALAAGVAVGAACSWLLALPTMRLSGLHYAVATLAFGEMVRIALQSWHFQRDHGDGPVGPAGIDGFRDIRWLLENDVSSLELLLLVLAVVAVALLLFSALERRRAGIAMRMTGHDDTLAAAQGIAVTRVRLAAAVAAGALAALGGGLYAHRATYIEPALFDPMLGVHAVGYALIGGMGTALGPIVGVLFDLGLLEATRLFAGWRMVVFGGLVALFLRWRPRGLLDEALVHRLSRHLELPRARPAGAVVNPLALVVLAMLVVIAPPVAAAPRPRVELQCESHGMGPLLDCTVRLADAQGVPLPSAQVTLSASMPSMPMAHSVKPVKAASGDKPGEYRGQLELEMNGVWAVQIEIGGLPDGRRDRVVRSLRIDDCPDGKRCPVPTAR